MDEAKFQEWWRTQLFGVGHYARLTPQDICRRGFFAGAESAEAELMTLRAEQQVQMDACDRDALIIQSLKKQLAERDETIAECRKLVELWRHLTGYALPSRQASELAAILAKEGEK